MSKFGSIAENEYERKIEYSFMKNEEKEEGKEQCK